MNKVVKAKAAYGETKTALKKTFRTLVRETRNALGNSSVVKDAKDKVNNAADKVKNA